MTRRDRLVPEGRRLTVATADGAALAVTDAGPVAGAPVVLAHCWTGGREVWAPVAHRLVAQGRRVVLYDQRGHGSSTLGADGCTMAALGDDLRAVLDALALERAVLAGHSMGGMALQALAAGHADALAGRVAGAVLVATTAGDLGRGRVLDALGVHAVSSPRVERWLRRRRSTALVRGAFGRTADADDVALTRDLFVACHPAVRAGFLHAMQAMDLRGALARTGWPVTVVVGTADRLTPVRHARALAAGTDGARLHALGHRGHMLPLETPDEITAAIVGSDRPTESDAVRRSTTTHRDS